MSYRVPESSWVEVGYRKSVCFFPLFLGLVVWLPSHRAPFVLWHSSFLSLGVALFSLAGVSFLGLLGVSLILRVFIQEGFAAR